MKDKSGNLGFASLISKNFYLPELNEYMRRYSELYDTINIDRYVNPTYEFKRFTNLNRISNRAIRKDE